LPEQLAGSDNAQEESGIASAVYIDAPGCRKGYENVRHTMTISFAQQVRIVVPT
jgi:hypothetical protein